MYVVLLNYTAPIEEIDYVLPDHAEWLAKQYENGHFLASGKREARIGGVILTRPMLRGKLDAILATDPFSVRHLARYEVIEFSPTKTAPELRLVNEAVTTHFGAS
ncbi:YciI family protein [Amycolatopsis sp. H20-H5]|uniref:YciI family protein n=1 Tax=Amycolatopsis sp. H20-H5 TaxID=3046309 RepID=UPI002DBD405B|nr:YciI family protein [Amycolatopsis sp. H20-H5]MEC3980125.1 YciI family protein [Amycolatopsis sp. H20-H5]